MPKQKKSLPDLRSMIADTQDQPPAASQSDDQKAGKAVKRKSGSTSTRETAKPGNQETGNEQTSQKKDSPADADHNAALPPVQVCVWIDPQVAGSIDMARGALATRLPKRPTRSKLVEAILREGLADVDALVDLLWHDAGGKAQK